METLEGAERCVIGSLFLSREAWPMVQRVMGPEMFADRRMAILWGAMEAMDAASIPVDEITLPRYLQQSSEFEQAGGWPILTECITAPFAASNADFYAAIVRDEFMRRQALMLGEGLVNKSKVHSFVPVEVFGDAKAEISMLESMSGITEPDTIQSVASKMFSDALSGKEIEKGLSTGFPQLDNKLGGMRKGNFFILAARTGIGKTSLALNVASHVALTLCQRVMIFSIEMSPEEITGYITASFGRVNLFAAHGRKLNADESAGLMDAAEKLSSRNLIMRCGGSQTLAGIVSEARAQHARMPLSLIVVDYIGLIQPDPGQRYENTQTRIAQSSRTLKALALDTGVPILCLAQLNRDADKQDRAPLLHDLRDSGSLEQDANVVLLLHRKLADEAKSPAPTTLAIAKARVMPRNTIIRLDFHGSKFRFVEAAFEDAE